MINVVPIEVLADRLASVLDGILEYDAETIRDLAIWFEATGDVLQKTGEHEEGLVAQAASRLLITIHDDPEKVVSLAAAILAESQRQSHPFAFVEMSRQALLNILLLWELHCMENDNPVFQHAVPDNRMPFESAYCGHMQHTTELMQCRSNQGSCP